MNNSFVVNLVGYSIFILLCLLIFCQNGCGQMALAPASKTRPYSTAVQRFQPQLPTQDQTEYFDLGYELIEGVTIFFPEQRFDYTLFQDVKGFNFTEDNVRYWLAMFSFCMGEHGGTHVDAPYHLNEFGWKLGEIPIQRMMNIPATIVDVEPHVFSFPNPQDFVVDLQYFLEHEARFGPIPFGSVILVHTGWSRFWPNKQQYLGTKSDGSLNFPGISGSAAQWLVKERGIVGIGIDTNSIDIGNVRGNPAAHIVLCGNNVYIIENVANLSMLLRRIRPIGVSRPLCDLRLTVLPIKSRGTGGPTRVVAHCNLSN